MGLRSFLWLLLLASWWGPSFLSIKVAVGEIPPLTLVVERVGMATLLLYIVLRMQGKNLPITLSFPSWAAIGSLLSLSVFGTALAYVLYYRILENTSATYVSMVTYLAPGLGVILGVIILKEQLGWNAYAGCALILLGVMVVNGILKNVSWRRPTTALVGRLL